MPAPAADAATPPPSDLPDRPAGRPALRFALLLSGLALALLLPALLLGGAVAWRAVAGQRAAAEGRLRDTAQALASAFERDLAGRIGALSVFATSTAFETYPPDLAALHDRARRAAAVLGTPVVVADGEGRQWISTLQPPGTPLPRGASFAAFARAVATGQPVVGDLVIGAMSRRAVFSVVVPVPEPGGAPRLVVASTPPVERLREILAGQGLPAGAFAAVSDARQVLVARSDAEHDRLVGRALPPENAARLGGGQPAMYRGPALDGVPRVFAAHPVPSAPGWMVVVAQPAAAFDAAWRAPLLALAAGGALVLASGAGIALLLARWLLRPLRHLTGHARAIAAGAALPPPLPPLRVAEFEALRHGFAAAEAALRDRAAALAASEARLRAVLDHVPVAVALAEAPSGRIALWSRRSEEILGHPDVAVPAVADYDAFEGYHADGRRVAAAEYPLARALAGEAAPALEYRYRRGDGRLAWMRSTAAPIRDADGAVAGAVVATADIDAERRAHDALAASETRFRSVVETAADGIILAGADGRIVSANPAALRLFGYEGDAAALEGRDLAALMPEAEGARHAGYLGAHRATGRARVIGVPGRSLLGRRRDGSEFPIDLSVGSFEIGGDRFFTGVVRDVSARRAAEAALAESEARFRGMADGAPVMIWVNGPDGGCRFVNAAYRRFFGCTEDQALDFGWAPAAHPEDAPGYVRGWLAAVAARVPFEAEARFRNAAGEYRWTRSRATPRFAEDGAFLGHVGITIDLHEQRGAEAALRQSEERLQLALEAGRMGIWDWDVAARRMRWDARQCELFGLEPAAPPPSGAAALARIQAEDRPAVEAAIRTALAEPGGTVHAAFRVPLPEGGPRWIRAHGRAVQGPQGGTRRMVGICYDITETVLAREVLAREAETLERLAETRARALADSEARLAHAAKMEALGRLAGGIAHDFNNILHAVEGGLRLAERRLAASPERARHYLGLAAAAAGRGKTVTGRLLSFARRGALRAEQLSPAAVLQGVAELLRPAIGPGIRLRVEAAAELPALLADPGQLEAVLVNLANNARDAMPQGGLLRLRAEAMPEAARRPPGLGPGPWLRLAVLDQGEGMAPEVLARVAEPFFTTKPKGRGTGLGLAMARGFAEQSGGALAIESAPGQGTTVALWLPQAGGAAQPAADAAAGAEVVRPAFRATVLLVEDEADLREIMAAELEERGFSAVAAADGVAALGMLESGLRPMAIVTDLAMPRGLDGLELLREARRMLPRLPAVLVTGHAGDALPEALAAAEQGGPFALVRKPSAAEVLVERLQRVLGEAPGQAVAGG